VKKTETFIGLNPQKEKSNEENILKIPFKKLEQRLRDEINDENNDKPGDDINDHSGDDNHQTNGILEQ